MTTFKDCPYCGEEILAKAIKCKHCHSMLGNLPGDKSLEDMASPQQPVVPAVTSPEEIQPAADPVIPVEEETMEPLATLPPSEGVSPSPPPPPSPPEGVSPSPPAPPSPPPAAGGSGQNQQITEKKSNGCLKGCLIVVLILLVLAVILFGAAYFMKDTLIDFFSNYFVQILDAL